MRFLPFLILVLFSVSAARAEENFDETLPQLLVEWLKSHGETEVVSDDQGIGLKGNPVRVQARVYEIKGSEEKGFTAELEFGVQITQKRRIIEYVAGVGKTEKEALGSAVANFVLSTFHVVYKGFLNPDDPHQPSEQIEIGGSAREVLRGPLVTLGTPPKEEYEEAISTGIKRALELLKPDREVHWLKIVYGQNRKEPMIVEVTFDNETNEGLTQRIGQLDWPKADEFYMAKQFILIK